MSDERIWASIGGPKAFCSYKLHTKTQLFCKNPNSVTGLCEQASCPLSNSRYATVREVDNKLMLYKKEPERCNKPKRAYEVIELKDYNNALAQIDEELKYFNDFIKHKCKQRLTKLWMSMERKGNDKIFTIEKRRFLKKEKKMGERAKKKIDVECEIEKVLLERMNAGVYGEEVKEALNGRVKIPEEKKTKGNKKKQKKFVSYFEESDEYLPAEELRKNKNLEW